MSFKTLLDVWSGKREPELSAERFSIRLPVDDAARVSALVELYPGNSAETIVSDLLNAALDEIEAAMPYVPGDKVIREDEFGDPIYEDVGTTPRFLALVKSYRQRLTGS